MTFCEALNNIKSKPSNFNTKWAIRKWNDGYSICPHSYVKRNPNINYFFYVSNR